MKSISQTKSIPRQTPLAPICVISGSFATYIDEHTELTLTTATADELSEYIEWRAARAKSVATVSRSIASIKCLYAYLCIHRYIETNPSTKLVPDKGTQKLPQILRVRKSTSCLTSRNALT